jgi:predicted Zn-ribbon and HTH transcriptional regulator
MSAFMSPKYRRLAGLAGGGGGAVVETSTPCGGCGYELLGLRRGGACPECGSPVPIAIGGTERVDPFLRLDTRQRARVRMGATLAAVALLAVAVEPLVTLVAGVVAAVTGGGGLLFPVGVRVVRFAACILWIAAGLTAAPTAIWTGPGWLGRAGRGPVLALLVGWGVGQMLLLAVAYEAGTRAVGAAAPGWTVTASGLSVGLRLLGGAAAAVVLLVIARAAEDAELEPGAERLLTGAMVLPVLGFVIWLIPNTMPWIFLLAYLLMFLLPWAWFAWRTGIGMLGVAQHVAWASRIGAQAAGRDDRVAATRAALDEQWRQRVRPLPGDGAAIPRHRGAGVTCADCGYDLRSTPVAAPCPECGGQAIVT